MTPTELFTLMPAKMVGIAVLVAPLTQIAKRALPGLHGWKSLAANFGLSAVTLLAATHDPTEIRTPQFWGNVLVATLTAAGVHGTGKGLGLFKVAFSLPADAQDPLDYNCPHFEPDVCGSPAGQPCHDVNGHVCPTHVERLAMVEHGGQMSEEVAAGAAGMADVAPLLGRPAGVKR